MLSDRDLANVLWIIVPAAIFLMFPAGRRAVAPVVRSGASRRAAIADTAASEIER